MRAGEDVDGFGFRCGWLFIVAMVARFEGSRAGRGWSEVGQHYPVLVACKFALYIAYQIHAYVFFSLLCMFPSRKKKLTGFRRNMLWQAII